MRPKYRIVTKGHFVPRYVLQERRWLFFYRFVARFDNQPQALLAMFRLIDDACKKALEEL